MTVYAAIRDRLRTWSIDVCDEIQQTPSRPYYLVTIRHAPPMGRRLTHQADTQPSTAWVMAVNNNPQGLRLLTGRAIALLDNYWLTPDGPAVVSFTGPVVVDESPGDWRWSQGIEVRIYQENTHAQS